MSKRRATLAGHNIPNERGAASTVPRLTSRIDQMVALDADMSDSEVWAGCDSEFSCTARGYEGNRGLPRQWARIKREWFIPSPRSHERHPAVPSSLSAQPVAGSTVTLPWQSTAASSTISTPAIKTPH